MKHLSLLILFLISTHLIICFENQIKTNNEVASSTNSESKTEAKTSTMLLGHPKVDLGNVNFPKGAKVFFEGWVKFFHYNNGTHFNRPKAFFQNSDYYGQRIPMAIRDKKDKYGLLRIPSQAHYFLVVYKDSLAFYTNRDRILMQLVDNLKIDFIKPVPEDQPTKGPIKDLGDFDEGKCVELSVKVPKSYQGEFKFTYKGRDQVWVICTDKGSERNKLFTLLIRLKVKLQRRFGRIATSASIKAGLKKSMASLFKNPKKRDLKIAKPRDGKWVLLQDWTKCTLSCGGGLSYQQFMCIPPKNGGKPCQGKAIRTKPCNTQKCPNVTEHLNRLKKEANIKPIVRVLPFSTRPQRYSKCFIKETDAYLMKVDAQGQLTQKQPVRILMNNKTFTIYEDDSYHTNVYSYQLENSQLFISGKQCCFSMKDNYHEYNFCGFESACGKKNEWAQGWNNDFNLFKFQCKTGIKLLNAQDLQILGEKMKNKMGQVKEDLVNGKQNIVNNRIKERDLLLMSNKIQNTQNMGLKVLSKELNIEELITKEEKQKEDLDYKNLLAKIKKEKSKKACLEKKIKEKRMEGETEINKHAFNQEVAKIKKDIALNIEIKRAEMKKKISLMRRRAQRRRAALLQQLTKVKSKMAAELMAANKKGSIKTCRKGKSNEKERVAYCNVNFNTEIVKNTECKEKDGFCYMCCENEFGDMFMKDRERCYNMCDNKKSSKKKKGSGRGKWVWRPKQVVIKNKLAK